MTEYGYARGQDTEWCATNPGDKTRMLCGRRRGWVPAAQPAKPHPLHDKCRERLEAHGEKLEAQS